jgi:hypothetical protein
MERNVFVDLTQERERGVVQRRTPPPSGQIKSIAVVVVVVEETGKGLWRPRENVPGGAECKPRLGHALEAAERPVGHPSKDLDEGALGEARRRLLLLLYVCVQTVRLGFPYSFFLDRKLDQRGVEQT